MMASVSLWAIFCICWKIFKAILSRLQKVFEKQNIEDLEPKSSRETYLIKLSDEIHMIEFLGQFGALFKLNINYIEFVYIHKFIDSDIWMFDKGRIDLLYAPNNDMLTSQKA